MIGVHSSAAAMKSLLRLSIFIKSSCFFLIRELRGKLADSHLSTFSLTTIIVGSIKGLSRECWLLSQMSAIPNPKMEPR